MAQVDLTKQEDMVQQVCAAVFSGEEGGEGEKNYLSCWLAWRDQCACCVYQQRSDLGLIPYTYRCFPVVEASFDAQVAVLEGAEQRRWYSRTGSLGS